jgi:hypothetical protein
MSFVVPEEISMIVSSDPSAGAINRSSDGSYFEVQLQDGLKIPTDALNVNVSVEEATVWWVVPNIITGENNRMYISGPNTADVLTTFSITIPQGLYDLSGLNQAVLRELENIGAKINPDPLINMTPDDATQKVEIRFNYNTVSIDFTQVDTPRDILGFNAQTYGPFPIVPTSVLAPNIAQFNQVNYFLIHSDLVNKGIRFNNNYNQTIAQVLIDVAPGSQIVSKPFNPAKINASELTGATRTYLRFWLTDDEDRRVNTNGEYWTARIVIHYLKPFIVGESK